MIYFIIMIFGAILGSFLNVLIYRLPKSEDVILKRSHCIECGHTLGIIDLIPIFSYLLNLGKCRYCGKKISIRYLLVEILASIILTSLFYFYGFSLDFLKMGIFLLGLLVMFFTDFETQIIPDEIIFSLIGTGVIILFFQKNNYLEYIYGAILGFSLLYLISFIGKFFYKKQALGRGDIKLAFVMGLFLGIKLNIIALYFSFVLGGIIGLFLVLSKLKKKTDYMAFGPYMILGALISIFFGDFLWKIYFG